MGWVYITWDSFWWVLGGSCHETKLKYATVYLYTPRQKTIHVKFCQSPLSPFSIVPADFFPFLALICTILRFALFFYSVPFFFLLVFFHFSFFFPWGWGCADSHFYHIFKVLVFFFVPSNWASFCQNYKIWSLVMI